MEIDQFIYTRVVESVSPFNKEGFQIVYYPLHLLEKKARLDISYRIIWQNSEEHSTKTALFFMEIKGEHRLILLNYTDLPGVEEELGSMVGHRGGIFLCHGFIFPQALWQALPSPLAARELVKGHIMEDLRSVFSSPFVDRDSGNMKPVVIDFLDKEVSGLKLPGLRSDLEWEIAALLCRSAAMEKGPKLLFRGAPEEVNSAVDRIMAHLPDALKICWGWDSVMDGGDMYQCPFRIAGYSSSMPTGAGPVQIDLSAPPRSLPTEVMPQAPATTCFDQWFTRCRGRIRLKSQIETAYRLSLFLEGQGASSGALLREKADDCFLTVNHEIIDDLFKKWCARQVDQGLASLISGHLTSEEKLDFLLGRAGVGELAAGIETVVLKVLPCPGTFKPVIGKDVIESSGGVLPILHHLWEKGRLEPDALTGLGPDDKAGVGKYLLACWPESPWLVDIFRQDKKLFNELASGQEAGEETRDHIRQMFHSFLSGHGFNRELAALITREALSRGKAHLLLRDDPAMPALGIMERMLCSGRFDDKDINALFSGRLKKNLPARGFPCLRAFLVPEDSIPPIFIKDREARKKFLSALMQFHRKKANDLLLMGFTMQEIQGMEDELLEARTGLWGAIKTIKKTLSFRRKKR